jgi:hypothetical protein
MNTANILAALEIAAALAQRIESITQQVRAAHETGTGITDEQLAVIRSGVDTSRANLVSAIDSLDSEAPPPAPDA